MAAKKSSTAKKKPAAKKGTAKKGNSRQPYVPKEKAEAMMRSRRQFTAIVLFSLAVLLFCIACISGDKGWGVLRSVYFGLFGFCTYLFPLLFVYIAIMISFEKYSRSAFAKIWETVAMIVLIAGAIFLFRDFSDGAYLETVKIGYKTAMDTVLNGGAVGAVIGGAIGKVLGATGGKVVICLLIFIFFMLITGATIVGIYQSMSKTAEKAREKREAMYEIYDEMQYREAAEAPEPVVETPVRRGRVKPDFNVPIEEPGVDIFAEEEPKPKKSRRKKEPEPEAIQPEEPVLGFDPKPVAIDDIVKKAAKTPAKKQDVGFVVAEKEAVQPTNAKYKLPDAELLNPAKSSSQDDMSDEMKGNAQILVDTLKSFGVETTITDISRGPSVTRYELKPAAGVRISRVTGLADDLALALASSGVRIEAPIPNKAAIGIEVPNKTSAMVSMREVIETAKFKAAKSRLTVGLGVDIAGNTVLADLAKMPHLLIAGTTGAGKSVCLNSMILSILFKAEPDEVKFIMIDPKGVELSVYNGIPHLLVPVVKNPRKASGALAWAVSEMLNRYNKFEDRKVRDLKSYNALAKKDKEIKPMEQIVIVVDELSDLMMAAPKEVEDSICRLAQMARAAGMHLVIATQRPSVDVITGLIKANVPSRLALKVSSGIDSRTILDAQGAEKLLGYGDMLFNPVGANKPTRIQGCYVADAEIEKVVDYIKAQAGAEYDDEIVKDMESKATQEKGTSASKGNDDEPAGDELLPKAIELVVETGTASTSFLQRRLSVGYARGARIVDELEERGIIGPAQGSKPRQVLITKQQWLEMNAMANDPAPIPESVEPEYEEEEPEVEEELEEEFGF